MLNPETIVSKDFITPWGLPKLKPPVKANLAPSSSSLGLPDFQASLINFLPWACASFWALRRFSLASISSSYFATIFKVFSSIFWVSRINFFLFSKCFNSFKLALSLAFCNLSCNFFSSNKILSICNWYFKLRSCACLSLFNLSSINLFNLCSVVYSLLILSSTSCVIASYKERVFSPILISESVKVSPSLTWFPHVTRLILSAMLFSFSLL